MKPRALVILILAAGALALILFVTSLHQADTTPGPPQPMRLTSIIAKSEVHRDPIELTSPGADRITDDIILHEDLWQSDGLTLYRPGAAVWVGGGPGCVLVAPDRIAAAAPDQSDCMGHIGDADQREIWDAVTQWRADQVRVGEHGAGS